MGLKTVYKWIGSTLSGRNITATFRGEIKEGLSPSAVCRGALYYPITVKPD